jgi:uncharacterized paraquat-inducible protein A
MATATRPVLALRQQRCQNHPQREASARCPECSRYYCRECITEHEDRVICATCLAKLTQKQEKKPRPWDLYARIGLFVIAFVAVFLFFLLLGDALLLIPSQFHQTGGW